MNLSFTPAVGEVPAANGEIALQYGALLFAQRIEAQERRVKSYAVPGFEDSHYLAVPGKYEPLALDARSRWRAFGMKAVPATSGNPLRPFDEPMVHLRGTMLRQSDGAEVEVALVPLGNAPTLRRPTFPVLP